jgi:nucleotide-binding universal stress UspA family protein
MEPLSNFAQSLVELHVTHERSEVMHTEAREQAKQHLRERIEHLCEKEGRLDPQGLPTVSEIEIVEGHPAVVVLDAAEKHDADLIIMGSHRHTVLGDAMLGTTTHKVLHSSERPVLVVRIPDGYHEEGF